jgi:hypothetical protein
MIIRFGFSRRCLTRYASRLDFCLWGPPDPTADEPLTDTELQKTVAWCTKPGHGMPYGEYYLHLLISMHLQVPGSFLLAHSGL